MNNVPVIKKIAITEKATDLQKAGKHVFMVELDATKNEIKKAVHARYRVNVASVSTLVRKPKMKRFRAVKSARGGGKIAIVTLKSGQTIDIHKS